MKIIIKPVGLFCILGAFVALVTLSLWHYKSSARSDGDSVAAAAPQPAADAAATAAQTAASSASPATTSSTQAILPPGVLLAPDIASNEWKSLIGNGHAQITVVPATVPGHPFARRVAVQDIGSNPWDLQIAHPLDVALRGGKRIQMSFWARSAESCPISAVVEENVDPYTRVIAKEENLTPAWAQFKEEWVQQSDTQDNWAKMDFQLGHKTGSVEITGVTIRQIDN